MGLVTINIDAMREMLTGITTAQSEVENLQHSLDLIMSNARWHVNKAPPPFVSTTRLGEVVYWLESQKAPLNIRIELAELLANTNTEIREVEIDESFLDKIDLTSAATDANTLQILFHKKDIAGILDILDRHQTQIPLGDGSSVTLYDPVFGALLAKNLAPTQLTDVLALLNSGGEKTNATQYDRLLRSIAGTLSTGARALSPDDLHTFTDAWAAVASIGPNPIDPPPDHSPKERLPSESPGLPPIPPDPLAPHSALPIQLLSLIIARGQWPNEFLTGMYNAITNQEDGAGANHWLKKPHSVWDPGVPDPTTGGYTLITDPMWGIFNTAVNNPEWVHTTFGTGDTTTLTIPDLDADPIVIPAPPRGHVVQPLMFIEVNTALHALLERGTADQATATTLVSMLSASDAYQVATGAQPTLLPQIDPILTDLQTIRNLSDAVHTLLDILSMIPLIGEAADLINGILYTIDNDKLNAALCFASILLPSALGLAVTAPRWIKLLKTGDNIPLPPVGKSTVPKTDLLDYLTQLGITPKQIAAYETNGIWPPGIQIPSGPSVFTPGTTEINWDVAPGKGFVTDANSNPIYTDPHFNPPAGYTIDRYGGPSGYFVSPVENGAPIPYGQRSLPFVEDPRQHHTYQFQGNLSEIKNYYHAAPPNARAEIDAYMARERLTWDQMISAPMGQVAAVPSFPGAVGGGTQIELPLPIDDLLAIGLIVEI